MKICAVANAEESNASRSTSVINNNYSIDTQNIILNQNNITINLVKFPDGTQPIELNYDAVNDLNAIGKCFRNGNLLQGVANYAKAVFEQAGNACVRKTNPRASYSMVHRGDDKWAMKLDKDVFPKLTCDISGNLLEFLEMSEQKLRFQKNLESILNAIMSEKNPDFKEAVQRITLMVVELSRNTVELMMQDAAKQLSQT
jgi:hypothetical protein